MCLPHNPRLSACPPVSYTHLDVYKRQVYGRLSVMLQAYCTVTSLFDVPPTAFRPPPKVDSAVARLVPHAPEQVGINDHKRFADVVRAAFGQRRKPLRLSLIHI